MGVVVRSEELGANFAEGEILLPLAYCLIILINFKNKRASRLAGLDVLITFRYTV